MPVFDVPPDPSSPAGDLRRADGKPNRAGTGDFDPGDGPGLDGPGLDVLGLDVLGLDNVRLDLPLAGIGSRSLAVVLDQILILLLLILWFVSCAAVVGLADAASGWAFAAMGIGGFLIFWSYFSIWEVVTDGQTPGKMALSIRTVSSIGGKPSLVAILIRNLMRGIDFLIGLPVMAYDRRYRRLGDLAASTLVVHDRPVRAEDEIHLQRVPRTWGAREIAIAEAFFRRAPRLEPEYAQRLATRLRDAISAREPEFISALALPSPELPSPGDPVAHLRILLGVDG